MTMKLFCFSTETWCTMASASPRPATNPWKWCKGEVVAAKPNPGAAKDQRMGEENYFECSRCSYKCIVHTFVLPSCLDLSSQRFSYETWKRITANILTTVMKIGTVFVQKPLTRLLLSDCCLKVYILYPISYISFPRYEWQKLFGMGTALPFSHKMLLQHSQLNAAALESACPFFSLLVTAALVSRKYNSNIKEREKERENPRELLYF